MDSTLAIFDGFPEPVCLVQEGGLIYYNRSAKELFPQLTLGEGLPVQLDNLLPMEEGDLMVVAELAEGSYQISLQHTPMGQLVILRPQASAYQLEAKHYSLYLRQQSTGLSAAIQQLSLQEGFSQNGRVKRYMAVANQGLQRLMRLSQQLDLLDRLGQRQVAMTSLDLAGLCQTIAREMEGITEEGGYTFAYQSNLTSLLMLGESGLLQQMIHILLANSMRDCPQEGSFGLRLSKQGRQAMLTFWNTGAEVAGTATARLFPAHRQSLAAKDGLGLGMELAQRIALLHKGTLLASPRSEGGLTVRVSLPIRPVHKLSVQSPRSRYESAGGFSPLLMALSDVLPYSFYQPEE